MVLRFINDLAGCNIVELKSCCCLHVGKFQKKDGFWRTGILLGPWFSLFLLKSNTDTEQLSDLELSIPVTWSEDAGFTFRLLYIL